MQPTRLFDFIQYQLDHFPCEKALSDLYLGNLRCYSIKQVEDISNQIAHGLIAQGLQAGDKVAIVVYRNRVEFTLLDLAIQKAGMISVPLYPTISPREYAYILNDSTCKAIFFGGQDLGEKIKQAQPKVPSLAKLFSLDAELGFVHWEAVWQNQPTTSIGADISPESLATIIYTSGTTGNPKGVMLTHTNILENVKSVHEVMPLEPGQRVMSFLPLCHIFERTASFSYLYQGVQVTYTALDNLGGEEGDLRRVQPHFMTCVPRLLEKIYEKIYQKGLELTGLKRKLFFWAMSLTDDYTYDKQYSGWAKMQRTIADKLIFSKWREALGGSVVGIITGSAPCPVKMARVFSAAGIPIREGYGLTESSPGLTINHFTEGMAMLGTVGPVLTNVKIRIDESDALYQDGEGEILAAGPNIMKGYYNKPEETAQVLEVVDGETWLHTGDVGKIVKNSQGVEFLKITDRKKELLKTSGGKYVAPAPIENKLKEDILIEQAMVVGDGRKFVSAIIVPAEEPLRNYCQHKGITWSSLEKMVELPEIISKYQSIVDQVNPNFARYEQIKKYSLSDQVWVPIKEDGTEGELTPTLKLKRRVLTQKYAEQIDKLYAP